MTTTCTLRGILFVLVLAVLPACNELVQNSNSYDDQRYGTSFVGAANFQLIAPTIAAKCSTCHYHAEWFEYSEQDFADAGLAINGNLAGSSIYYRLSNSPIAGPQPRNMPQGGGAAFTDAELALMENWINNMFL
jgi:uncharacterized membrane protein